MKKLKIKLTGVSPLVMHNNQLVDPLNPLKKEISALTSKTKKTDADHMEIRRLEFKAGLYFREVEGPILPSQNFRACLIQGARKSKKGKNFESGLFVLKDATLGYEGPRTVKSLYESGFAWTVPAGNQRNTIMRTRPKFDDWSAEYEIKFNPDLISLSDIDEALSHSGLSGIGDARSLGYGRFESEVIAV